MSDSVLGLPPRSTWMTRCAMRSTVVAAGVTATFAGSLQHLPGQLGDVLRHGGREQQRLPLRRQLGDDFADVVDEAHVEHAVGLVEHEGVDAIEPQRMALHEVEQAAGRGDEHVDAVLRARGPGAPIGTPPMASVDSMPQVPSVGAEAVEDLAGELAGRAQHQHAAGLAFRRWRLLARWLRIGSAKAAVLPVPVWAMPMRSRPASRSGMVWAWIGVGVTYFSSVECTGDRLCEAEVVKRVQ